MNGFDHESPGSISPPDESPTDELYVLPTNEPTSDFPNFFESLDELPMSLGDVSGRKAAKDQFSIVIEGLTKNKAPVTVELLGDKALVAIEGQSGTTWYEAKNLSPRKAGKLVTEVIKEVASVAIGDDQGDTTCYVAQDLTAKEAVKLVEDIREGTIDFEELRKQALGDVEGGVDRIIESVGKVATEAAASVFFGKVGEVMVTVVGPPVAIAISGVMTALSRDEAAISATSAIVSGVMLSFTGPPIAMFLTVGTAMVAKLLQEKMSQE